MGGKAEDTTVLTARIEELERRLPQLEARVDESERHMLRSEMDRHVPPPLSPARASLASDSGYGIGADEAGPHPHPALSWLP